MLICFLSFFIPYSHSIKYLTLLYKHFPFSFALRQDYVLTQCVLLNNILSFFWISRISFSSAYNTFFVMSSCRVQSIFFLWEKTLKSVQLADIKRESRKAIGKEYKSVIVQKKVLLNCNRTLAFDSELKAVQQLLVECAFQFDAICDALNTAHFFYSNSDYFVRFKSFVAACQL